jgi:hypothetical protein
VGAGKWARHIPIGRRSGPDVVYVRLQSDTAFLGKANGDPRRLGVEIRSLRLLDAR